ncbi:MAG: dihydrolipoamide dehydrogenase, partial [Thermoproteota archaeon]|nr:dihydrolipoamide dehydrogenase [Thermoproteota archaeon]
MSQKGLKVAVIEKDKMGGTCLNRGFIPSKPLIHSANVAETIKNSDVHLGYEMESVSKNSTNDDGVEEPTT